MEYVVASGSTSDIASLPHGEAVLVSAQASFSSPLCIAAHSSACALYAMCYFCVICLSRYIDRFV